MQEIFQKDKKLKFFAREAQFSHQLNFGTFFVWSKILLGTLENRKPLPIVRLETNSVNTLLNIMDYISRTKPFSFFFLIFGYLD